MHACMHACTHLLRNPLRRHATVMGYSTKISGSSSQRFKRVIPNTPLCFQRHACVHCMHACMHVYMCIHLGETSGGASCLFGDRLFDSSYDGRRSPAKPPPGPVWSSSHVSARASRFFSPPGAAIYLVSPLTDINLAFKSDGQFLFGFPVD